MSAATSIGHRIMKPLTVEHHLAKMEALLDEHGRIVAGVTDLVGADAVRRGVITGDAVARHGESVKAAVRAVEDLNNGLFVRGKLASGIATVRHPETLEQVTTHRTPLFDDMVQMLVPSSYPTGTVLKRDEVWSNAAFRKLDDAAQLKPNYHASALGDQWASFSLAEQQVPHIRQAIAAVRDLLHTPAVRAA